MIYENKYGRLEVEEASEELLVGHMSYNSAPEKHYIDDLEKIGIISGGAISVALNYPPHNPAQGYTFIYTGTKTAKYIKVISLEWNQEYDSVKASAQLANQRSIELPDIPYDVYYF